MKREDRHYRPDEWLAYIQDLLPDPLRNQMEEHLAVCEHCLLYYMMSLEGLPLAEPEERLGSPHLADDVMRLILEEAGKPSKDSRDRWYRRTLVHYAAAAAITIIMMSVGLFQEMLPGQLDRWEADSRQQSHSLSERLMDRTSTFLDSLKPKETGGLNREP